MQTSNDFQSLHRFFNSLWQGCTGYIDLRLIPEGGGRPQDIYREVPDFLNHFDATGYDWLIKQNATYHIYHRIGISTEPRDSKTHITQLPAFWCDVDDNSPEALHTLQDLAPTMIVASGGGYHGYWLLDTPLAIESEDTLDEVEQILDGIALASNGDRAVKNSNRILRLPTFYNIKSKYGDDKPKARVLFCDDDWGRYAYQTLKREYKALGARKTIRIDASTIDKRLWQTSSNESSYLVWYQQNGHLVGRGERNAKLYGAARDANNAGWSQGQAESVLLPIAMGSGLKQAEALTTIRSAYRHSATLTVHTPIGKLVTRRKLDQLKFTSSV